MSLADDREPKADDGLLLLLLRPRTVRINSALDLRDALLVFDHHGGHSDHAGHHNSADRNQQPSKPEKLLYDSLHAASPHFVVRRPSCAILRATCDVKRA